LPVAIDDGDGGDGRAEQFGGFVHDALQIGVGTALENARTVHRLLALLLILWKIHRKQIDMYHVFFSDCSGRTQIVSGSLTKPPKWIDFTSGTDPGTAAAPALCSA
jgi:hypothetical protein